MMIATHRVTVHVATVVMMILMVTMISIDRKEQTHSANESVCSVIVSIAHVSFNLPLLVGSLVKNFLKMNLALFFGFTEINRYNSIMKTSSINVVSSLTSSFTITKANETCVRVFIILVYINFDILNLTKLGEHRI